MRPGVEHGTCQARVVRQRAGGRAEQVLGSAGARLTVVELDACLAAGRVVPRGDRTVAGETSVDAVIAAAGVAA